MSLARYVHTIRYLRPVQIFGQVWFRVYRPSPDVRPAPSLRTPNGSWQAWSWRTPAMSEAAAFRFLNVAGRLDSSSDWDDPARSKLWRYNLHYFDDLVALGADQRQAWHLALLERWIRENPPGEGSGWEPYPTSLRIANWIKWALENRARGTVVLDAQALDSLAAQTRWLGKKVEIHILANHLWANAKALVMAGLFFEGPEAQQWLDRGASILRRELPEQILPDGGHFERSPMYHATVLEDVLDLVNAARTFGASFPTTLGDALREAATRMLQWLRVMSHPDGGIAFFNDAAFNIAADFGQLSAYARQLGITVIERPLAPVEALPDSGYVRLQNERATVLCDVAPVGPDYLPGHAHADSLSFEISVDGRRVLVNEGTSTYDPGPERHRQRGTAAHNTVVVDEQDSSEVWGGFRVARRARPFDVTWGSDARGLQAAAAHDGYHRLPGRVTHRREWLLDGEGLSISDRLDGRFQAARAVFHVHPDFTSQRNTTSNAVALSRSDVAGSLTLACAPSAGLSSRQSTWHPRFGESQITTTVEAPFETASLVTRLSW